MHRKGPAAARPARHSKAQFVQDAHCQLATVPEFNDVVSTDLDEAAAADALTSTGLFGCLPASTFPRNSAPSSMANRSVCTSPVTWPVLQSCTLSRPVTFLPFFPLTLTPLPLPSPFH